jgi:ankyrin repeat protein
LNPRDVRGRTTFFYVALHNSKEALAYLLDHGANPTMNDAEGISPREICCDREDLIVMLAKYGG